MKSGSLRKKGVILKLDFEKAYDKVQWDFLEEVMTRKGFSKIWIDQVMITVREGKVSININGGSWSIFPYLQRIEARRSFVASFVQPGGRCISRNH